MVGRPLIFVLGTELGSSAGVVCALNSRVTSPDPQFCINIYVCMYIAHMYIYTYVCVPEILKAEK